MTERQKLIIQSKIFKTAEYVPEGGFGEAYENAHFNLKFTLKECADLLSVDEETAERLIEGWVLEFDSYVNFACRSLIEERNR